MTDEDQVAAAVEVAAEGESLNILVANAGSAAPGSLLAMGKGEWEFTLGLNVIGTALCIKHAALSMQDRGGAIVAISSTSGTKVQPWMATYVTSKAAVDMLVRAAAIELSPYRIRVNSIQPGYVPTEISSSLFPQALDETLVRATPLGRSGTAADIGAMVAFLATDTASWITGQTFGVDGGLDIPVMPSMAPLAEVLFGSETVESAALPDFTALNVDGAER